MREEPLEKIIYQGQIRTKKLNKLIARLDVLSAGTKISLQEIDAAIEANRKHLDALVVLKLNALRRAN